MVDIAKRFYGPCVSSPDAPVLDVGALVERLLVFDTVVLHSALLCEIEGLVGAFGTDGTTSLIQNGDVEIHAEALSAGARDSNRLGPGSIEVVYVRVADAKANASGWLQRIPSIPGLTYREAKKLKSVVGTHLRFAPQDAGVATRRQTQIDVEGLPGLLQLALAIAAKEELGHPVVADDLEVSCQHDGDTYLLESDVARRFDFDPQREVKVHKQALLALAHLNEQIERMRTFSALVGFREDDTELLTRKLAALTHPVPGDARPQLSRVVSAAGLPDLGKAAADGRLNFSQLVEIRRSDEAAAFRDWLRRAHDVSDDDLRTLTAGLAVRVSRAVNSPTGRVLRVLVPTVGLMGLDPTAGGVAGTALGLLDQFIWDRVLPKKGPWSLVSEQFPSLFRD